MKPEGGVFIFNLVDFKGPIVLSLFTDNWNEPSFFFFGPVFGLFSLIKSLYAEKEMNDQDITPPNPLTLNLRIY